MNREQSKNIISLIETEYKTLIDDVRVDKIIKLLIFGTGNIRLLNKILRYNRNLSVGEKTRIQTTIGILKAYNKKIKQLRKKGRGIANTNKKICSLRSHILIARSSLRSQE